MSDGAIYAMLGGIVVAVLNFVVNPWVQARLNRAKENDPVLGWKTAIEELRSQAERLTNRVKTLEDENETLEAKVAALETQVNERSAIIARLERTVVQQGRMIDARDRYLGRLKDAWRDRHQEEPPAPLPAYAYWLTYDPTGDSQ